MLFFVCLFVVVFVFVVCVCVCVVSWLGCCFGFLVFVVVFVGFCLFVLIDDRLYSAILRSLEQTHCARRWFYMSDWLFIARF